METQAFENAQIHQVFTFKSNILSSHLAQISIEIDNSIIQPLCQQTINLFTSRSIDGLSLENLPCEYIEENYKEEIQNKLNTYLFRNIVLDHLMNYIIDLKIPYAHYPRLSNIQTTANHSLTFTFDVSLADSLELKEWKHFAFKTPKRKRYKDLDKQVKQFLDDETDMAKTRNELVIQEDDWIGFTTLLVDENGKDLSPYLAGSFWLKIQSNTPNSISRELFLGKQFGESFITQDLIFEEDYSGLEQKRYNFLVTITAIVKGKHLSLDLFKNSFKLKNKTEIHTKLIEVFSYRNDLSQRKMIIEELFNLLLSKHRFEIPKHLVLRRQEDIIESLSKQPDYHVYKLQKDFLNSISSLAEKQLKEEVMIDQIAYNENIKANTKDILHYLHLFNNKRLEEFVYFKPTLENLEDIQTPINTSSLVQAVIREKTVNYIIYTLTQ